MDIDSKITIMFSDGEEYTEHLSDVISGKIPLPPKEKFDQSYRVYIDRRLSVETGTWNGLIVNFPKNLPKKRKK
jgi:hypothetical protein